MVPGRSSEQHGSHEGDAAAPSRNSTITILAALADQHDPVSVAELAMLTGLHRASLYRNIETLADEGLVTRLPDTPRHYAIGAEFIRIGLRALRHFELRTMLLPYLVELASETREACSLLFYDQGEALATDSVYLPEQPIVTVAEGVRMPCHGHAMGQVMLAFQREEEIARVLSQPLRRYTARTVTDPAQLREILAACRRQGYAFSYAGMHEAFGTAGFPVLDRDGIAVASLGVRVLQAEGPSESTIATGKAIANRASTRLGYPSGLLGGF